MQTEENRQLGFVPLVSCLLRACVSLTANFTICLIQLPSLVSRQLSSWSELHKREFGWNTCNALARNFGLNRSQVYNMIVIGLHDRLHVCSNISTYCMILYCLRQNISYSSLKCQGRWTILFSLKVFISISQLIS